jgi:AcrR family transcriptional regulator
MSANPPPIERRRKPDEIRAQALEVGRRLLVEQGVHALTLKAIGAEVGTSHANLIYHFGSAEDFQVMLKDRLVQELTDAVKAMVERYRSGECELAAIVDAVLSAYSAGGVGRLLAWLALTGKMGGAQGLTGSIAELVEVLEGVVPGDGAAERARDLVWVMTGMALLESLYGETLNAMLGGQEIGARDRTVALLERLTAR